MSLNIHRRNYNTAVSPDMIPLQSGRGKELNIKSWIVLVKESQARPELIYMLLYLLNITLTLTLTHLKKNKNDPLFHNTI